MSNRPCFICSQPSVSSCHREHDEDVYFCSKAHERLHSNGDHCFPIKIVESPDVGRFIQAPRRILKGEVIFQETPGLVGPNPVVQTPICVACYKQVNPSCLCSSCGFPLCRDLCEDHGTICEYLSRFDMNLTLDEICRSSILHTILPLKLLLSKESNPDVYNCLNKLMDHREDRIKDEEYLEGISIPILNPLQKSLGLDPEKILKALGIVEVNNYEIFNLTGNSGFRGLFCLTSLLSHDCVPNARPIINRKAPYESTMIATRDIEDGEAVTINYVHTQKPNRIRKKTLKENWYFDCSCRRCQDVTEFNLFPDAIKCDACSGGRIIPCKDFYSCDRCSNEKSVSHIQELMEKFETYKSKIDRPNVPQYLKFYYQCSKILTSNHYFLNSLRRWIIPLYCRPLASNPNVIPTFEMLKEKIRLCEDYLLTLNQIEPGLSKNRGKVLYEWAESSFKVYGNSRNLDGLKSIDLALKEAIACLRHEPESSFEHSIREAAINSLKLVNEIIEGN